MNELKVYKICITVTRVQLLSFQARLLPRPLMGRLYYYTHVMIH